MASWSEPQQGLRMSPLLSDVGFTSAAVLDHVQPPPSCVREVTHIYFKLSITIQTKKSAVVWVSCQLGSLLPLILPALFSSSLPYPSPFYPTTVSRVSTPSSPTYSLFFAALLIHFTFHPFLSASHPVTENTDQSAVNSLCSRYDPGFLHFKSPLVLQLESPYLICFLQILMFNCFWLYLADDEIKYNGQPPT